MKIRLTGTSAQIEAFLLTFQLRMGGTCKYISKEYPQTRKCKSSQYVSVYIDYDEAQNND